jgi:hypothetical protein
MKAAAIRSLLLGALGAVVIVTAAAVPAGAASLSPEQVMPDHQVVTAASNSPGQVMPDRMRF